MDTGKLTTIISKYFKIIAFREPVGGLIGDLEVRELVVEPLTSDVDEAFNKVYVELTKHHVIPVLDHTQGLLVLRVIEKPEIFMHKGLLRRYLPFILFTITIVTVYLSGLYLAQGFRELVGSTENIGLDAILYTLSLMGVLLVHELGHYITARLSGIPVSLPYFIPAPPASIGMLGTFGAVINMKLPPKTINKLALIGIMGPLTGFIAAIPVAIVGISLSAKIPIEEAHVLPNEIIEIRAIPLILRVILDNIVGGNVTVLSHPVLLASYFLFLITFLNLLPIGQLDGGHVVRALVQPETHRAISIGISAFLLVLGLILSYTVDAIYMVLVFFSVLALILTGRRVHVGVLNPLSKLTGYYRIIPIVYVILLVLTMPVPG